jgi:hypothetical protein
MGNLIAHDVNDFKCVGFVVLVDEKFNNSIVFHLLEFGTCFSLEAIIDLGFGGKNMLNLATHILF